MKHMFTERMVARCLIIIFSLVLIFHVCVIVGIVPFEIVWGGKMSDPKEMMYFEIGSIAINLTMLAIVLVYAGYLKIQIKPVVIKVALWLMSALFVLNTVGNIFSANETEKMIFTPITAVLALLCFRLAIGKEEKTVV